MNAQQTLLSKIEVGDWILTDTSGDPAPFARPKNEDATAHRVADVYFERDEWSGKVYTLTLDDGRKTEPRYGTAHVYLTEAPEYQAEPPTHVEVDGVVVAETRHIAPVEPEKPAGTGEVASTELVAALTAVLPLTLKDDTLPMLGAVKFESDGDELLLAATDRYVLGTYRVPWDGGHVDAVVRGDGARDLLAWARKAEKFAPIRLTFGEREVEAFGYDRRATFPLYDGEFVRWRAILPEDDPADIVFGLNKEFIGRFAKAGEKGETMRVSFRSPAKPLRVQIGERFDGLIMPVRLPDVEGRASAPRYANEWKPEPEVKPVDEPPVYPKCPVCFQLSKDCWDHPDTGGSVIRSEWHPERIALRDRINAEAEAAIHAKPEAIHAEPVEISSGARCSTCKGYGVVRKFGKDKGGKYKTAKGAAEATEKGNSMPCPVCQLAQAA